MKFTQSEWRFDRIPERELEAAWNWEIEREAGSGKPAWLSMPAEQRRAVLGLFDSPSAAITEIQRADPGQWEREEGLCDGLPLSVHLLRIDWGRGKTAVLKAFEEWMDSEPRPRCGEYTNPGGRQLSPAAWLCDLAIYRAHKAGMTHAQTAATLGRIVMWAGANSRATAIGQSRAMQRTRQRAQARQLVVSRIAQHLP